MEVFPKPPGHHLIDVGVGEWRINVSFSWLKVAVVSRPRRYVPWPNSVWA